VSGFRNHQEEITAALAEHQSHEVQLLHEGRETFQGHDDPLGTIFRATSPKPGCPGVRVDPKTGAEWYSAAWLDAGRGI
jgi:hypothetical protein